MDTKPLTHSTQPNVLSWVLCCWHLLYLYRLLSKALKDLENWRHFVNKLASPSDGSYKSRLSSAKVSIQPTLFSVDTKAAVVVARNVFLIKELNSCVNSFHISFNTIFHEHNTRPIWISEQIFAQGGNSDVWIQDLWGSNSIFGRARVKCFFKSNYFAVIQTIHTTSHPPWLTQNTSKGFSDLYSQLRFVNGLKECMATDGNGNWIPYKRALRFPWGHTKTERNSILHKQLKITTCWKCHGKWFIVLHPQSITLFV